jgi:hypothetical protein
MVIKPPHITNCVYAHGVTLHVRVAAFTAPSKLATCDIPLHHTHMCTHTSSSTYIHAQLTYMGGPAGIMQSGKKFMI